MALLFSSNNGRVQHGSLANTDDIAAGTAACWFRQTVGNSEEARFYEKSTNTRWELFPGSATLLSSYVIIRATSNLIVRAGTNGFSTWDTGKWLFAAVTWDINGASGDQHLYMGTLTSDAVEASAYSTQQVGSGARTSDAASNLSVAGNTAGSTEEFNGDFAWFGLWTRQLALAELVNQQYHPRVTDQVLFCHYGLHHGISQQFDESGNANHGTITNGAFSQHVPILGSFMSFMPGNL